VIAVIAVLVAVVVSILVAEASDGNSRLRSWIWCRKHGLRLREQATCLGGGAVFWWGEDSNGRAYIPGRGGAPVPAGGAGRSAGG